MRHVAKETAMLICARIFMTIDLHAADPCVRCHHAVPRITITDGGAVISCTSCGHRSRTFPDPKRAIAAWNHDWRSARSRLYRFGEQLLCFFLEHRLGDATRIDAKGIWRHCSRCKRDIVRPQPSIVRRTTKRSNYVTPTAAAK